MLIQPTDVRQSALGREEPEHPDRDRMFAPMVATVTHVYPVGHDKNPAGQTLVDIQFNGNMAPWRKVPLGASYAHGETDKAVANSRTRQPYDAKARNQMDGAVYDVRPGTRVLVGFPSGDMRAPVILSTLKFNRQGELDAPVERRGLDRFDDDGHVAMVEAHPVDASMDEYPRASDSFNGSVFERDNRGNMTFQATTDHDPVFPGHNGIPIAPEPQGNILHSTRGARMGRQGRVTGKHPITGDAGDGSIRDETINATKGSLIVWLRSKVGRLWMSTRGSDDARVYIENDDRSYVGLDGQEGGIHAAAKAFLDAAEVCLGNLDPQYHAVLYEPLTEFVEQVVTTYDTHTHGGVSSGEDSTLMPNQLLFPVFLQYELGAKWKSDHVRLVKAEGATPSYQNDPDGNDSGGSPPATPTPPAPTEPPRRKGGAGGGGMFLSPKFPRDKLGRRIKT